MTVISAEEQFKGRQAQIKRACRKSSPESTLLKSFLSLKTTIQYFRTVDILDFDEAAATQFKHLRKQKIRIGVQDLRIAAIVLARSAVLVTANRQDFGKIPGLAIEDWSKK